MDALALLCTLHADGPATLKRLRARGYPDLGTLLQRSAKDLGEDLDVEPAFARRLLREAKLLAARVGAEGLEAEEAPPIVTAEDKAPLVSPQAEGMASTLSDSDRSFVERIVAAPKLSDGSVEPVVPVEREEAQRAAEPIVAEPFVAEPFVAGPTAAEPFVAEPFVAEPTAAEPTAAEPTAAEPTAAEPTAAEPQAALPDSPGPGALEGASLPGLDSELIFDLKASGISTLEQLADADSLELTRALGVTFAQARRLGFLARRAAAAVPAAEPTAAEPTAAEPTAAEPTAAEPTAAEPTAAEPAGGTPAPAAETPSPPVAPSPKEELPQVTLAPHRRSVEQVAPAVGEAVDAGSDAGSDAAIIAGEPVKPAESGERKPFWEPRDFLTPPRESEESEAEPKQGVKVDPSEIAPRPRFGDRLAQAAASERQRSRIAQAVRGSEVDAAADAQAGTSGGTASRTVLGWNFEVPRPQSEPALPLGSLAIPSEPAVEQQDPEGGVPSASALGDQERGGPFA